MVSLPGECEIYGSGKRSREATHKWKGFRVGELFKSDRPQASEVAARQHLNTKRGSAFVSENANLFWVLHKQDKRR